MTLKNERLMSADQLPPFRLRWADEAECNLVGLSGQEAVAVSISRSDESFAVYHNGDLLAVWGYTRGSVLVGGAGLWLLTTPLADVHRKEFVRECLRLLPIVLDIFGKVSFTVWAKHEGAMRLATRLGFRPIQSKGIYGPEMTVMERAA